MFHRRSLAPFPIAVASAALLVAGAAAAQPKTKAVPGAPPIQAATPAPQTEPALPDVSDPLLDPPPPPAHVLTTWQQGLQLVRERSVTIRVARANILRAQGQVDIALAPALPSVLGQAGVTQYLLKGDSPFAAGGAVVGGSTGGGTTGGGTTGGGTTGGGTTGGGGSIAAGSTTAARIPDPSRIYFAQAGLTVPLFRPSAWYNYGSAKDQVEATRLTTQETERQVVAGVANLIVSVVTAERLAEVSRESLRAALSTVDLTKRRAALGASNTLDVLRVEGEASLSRAQVVMTTESLIEAREALGSALGSAQPWSVTPNVQLDSLAADVLKNCHVENDIFNRSDVRAAQANVGVAERNVKGVDYAYFPTVDANSTLGVQDPRYALNNRHVNWTIGALLTWQIYDGGLRGGQRRVAKADAEVARADLYESKRFASLQVTQARRAVQVAEANLAVSAKTREIDAENVRLTKISFLNGSGTSFDLVLTESQLRVAEADLAVKEFNVLEAKIAALLAMSSCNL